MQRLTIYEVGPRDGLQNEATVLTTTQKLELIARLVQAGLSCVEVTSFVSQKAVPQLADAAHVMARAGGAWPAATLTSLVINEAGYERAVAAGCRAVAVVVIASETLSARNSRMGVDESVAVCCRLLERAHRDGVATRVYLSAAWVCPYEGPTPPGRVLELAQRVEGAQPEQFVIADSIGHAHPREVEELLLALAPVVGVGRLAVHLHDTLGFGLANACAALRAGVRTIDASIGGLGGCPFAAGAAGNLATEDLVLLAEKMGYQTGVDLASLRHTVANLDALLGRRVGGRSRAWWQSDATCAGTRQGAGAAALGATNTVPMGAS